MKTFAAMAVIIPLSMSAAWAGGPSFKIEPGSILSPSYKRPTPHHDEPRPVVSPPLTPFDRNMVPPGYAESKSDSGTVIDLSEPLSFGYPKSKKR
jgi:hypothetical protein